jgi:hypothetical protein
MRSFSGLVADGLKEVEERGDDEKDGEMSVFGHKVPKVPKSLAVETSNLPPPTDTAEEWSASVSEGDADADAETEVRVFLPLCSFFFHSSLTSSIFSFNLFFFCSAEHWLFLESIGRRTCPERESRTAAPQTGWQLVHATP